MNSCGRFSLSYDEQKIKDDILEILLEQSETHDELSVEDIYNALPDTEEFDQEFIYEIIGELRKQGVEITEEEGDATIDDDEIPMTDMDPYAGLGHISSDDTISLYLREMSRVPLLDSREEIALAIRIENGKAAQIELGKLNGNATPQQKQELEKVVDNGKEARAHPSKPTHAWWLHATANEPGVPSCPDAEASGADESGGEI